MQISIATSNHDPSDIEQLRDWFTSEWGTIDPIYAANCPPPILSKDNNRLVGGLSFTQAQRPDSDLHAIWINAVYVEPGNRGKGIATLLIHRAESLALESELKELFVFTKFPQLYANLTWERLTEDANGHVLWREL